MEKKTKYLAYTLLLLSVPLDMLFKHLNPDFPEISIIIRNIYSVCFLLASGLLIWRGVYYWRKQGYQNKFLSELLLGLLLAIGMTSFLYLTKEQVKSSLQIVNIYKDKELTENKRLNDLLARNAYVTDGRILKYNGTVYKPTKEDQEQRQTILDIHHGLEVIQQGIYNWISLILLSILLGLFWPLKKDFLTN